MKKKMIYVVAALIVSAVAMFNVKTVLEANRAYDLTMTSIDALSEDGDGESGESGSIEEKFTKNHINDPKDCTITETRECTIGVTIPPWIPKLGGLKCESTFTYKVKFEGTINSCLFTGNPANACDYYRCRKNGSG